MKIELSTFANSFESLRLRAKPVAHRIVFWTVVTMLIAYMFIPREYAFAQSADDTGLPTTFPYTKTFVITGYYSPLPDQSFYVTGSYESDKRLNGNGTNGADGTEVYPGMIAAPREFAFGTKMTIPGIGTVAVHDRGGAIKQNRLDIWMGKGEVGLARALAWGKRSVSVTVYGVDNSIAENVTIDQLALASLSAYKTRYSAKQTVSAPSVTYKDIAYGDNGDEVRLLQEYLTLLDYFDETPTGYFGESTRDAVTQFQIDTNVIQSKDETGSGVFGPKTREMFRAQLEKNRIEELEKVPTENLYKGKVSQAVQDLNYFLNQFGYLAKLESTSTKFDSVTEEALKRFQFDLDIIKTDKDVGTGSYGPKTQSVLKKLVENRWSLATDLRILQSSNLLSFTAKLDPGTQSADVQELQRMLRDLHFLGITPNGYYGRSTKHAVFKFQQSRNIVEKETDDGAGLVGPKTLTALNEISNSRNNQQLLIGKRTDEIKVVAQRLDTEKALIASVGIPTVVFSEHASYGTTSVTVQNLQKVLKQLGFFSGKVVTDYFGDITKKSLISFQQTHGLEATGELDDQTRSVLNELLKKS